MDASSIHSNASDLKKDDLVTAEHVEHVDLAVEYTRNVNAKIVNPLAGISKDELHHKVDAFCDSWGFQEHKEVFWKGALAAQNPKDYENIPELLEEDKIHIRREVTHRWHLPKDLYFAIALCSLGSAVQGWDNTGANGANLSFPQEFGIEHNHWLVGVINSGPTLFGLASAWAADPVNNYLGRRGAIFATGLFCIFPVLAQAFTQNWWGLLLCRLFMGLGMGIKISTIPVYSAEISPASIRGGMVTSFQLWVAFGIFIGQCSNLIFFRIGRLAWRFQLAAAFVPAIPIVILIWFCPESPRWLLKKGRYQEAFTAFKRLRNTDVIAARELYYAHCQISEEHNAFAGISLGRRIADLFVIPRLRRATVASAVIVISQQFSGINIMSFYSSTIFSEAGYNAKECLLVSMGFGLIMFVFAIPAVYTMDTFGRRNLLLVTFPNMAWCLLAAGFCFLMSESNSARVPLIAFFIFLFTALYGPGKSYVAPGCAALD
jgi:sugar porter (SP) family MFS transporter